MHEVMAPVLSAKGVKYRMRDNAFVSVANPDALQTAASSLDPKRIQDRLEYWTFLLGPKFSAHEREGMDLHRRYFISQVEYALNIIFKRNHSIHTIFERSCDLGLARLTLNRIANIFGWRVTRRTNGKHQVVLEQIDHAHHILRAYSKNSFVKQYEKFIAFLRIETCSNNLKDFHQKKSLEYPPQC